MKNGQIPCGCGGTKWSENQFKILVTRFCSKKGYVFHGWAENYRGNKTLLRLENTNTGNFWNSTNIANLFNGYGDPAVARVENAKQRRVEDSIHIDAFLKAGFTEDHVFWRSKRLNSTGGKDYWYYFCPECSNDEYFESGVCDGIFESQAGDLKSGQKSCRCSSTYRWTKEQREYQIQKELKHGFFVSWEGDYKNAQSRFNWVCSKGHSCVTRVSSFLNNSTRCSKCVKSGVGYRGYYPERSQEKDYRYLIKFKKDEAIKVGRSFNVLNRLNKGNSSLLKISNHKIDEIEVLKIVTADHETIFNLEQSIHYCLKKEGFHKPLRWTGEGFNYKCEELLNLLVRKSGIKSDNISVEFMNTIKDLKG